MSIAKTINDRMEKLDKMSEEATAETKKLIAEARDIHTKATTQIELYASKKELSKAEQKKYSELVIERLMAENAYNMLENILK